MVMMQLGAFFFFELNQIDSTRIILIHHFTQALHYWQMSAVSVSVCEKLTEVKFVFGNEVGPDGLGPPNNRTVCTFSPGERMLSEKIRYLETSLVWEKKPMSLTFLYIYDPHFCFDLRAFLHFLSLSGPIFFRKKTVHPKRCSLGFLRCLWRTFCLAPISGKSNGGSNSRISAEVGGTTTGCPPEVTHSKFTTIGPN